MAKITINGEVFQFDLIRKPMSEALAIETGLKCRYADWEADLQAGSARALAGFIWLVWRRDGRAVEFADIESGAVEVNLAGFEVEDGTPDPTISPAAKGASTGTGANTSRRSAS